VPHTQRGHCEAQGIGHYSATSAVHLPVSTLRLRSIGGEVSDSFNELFRALYAAGLSKAPG
jgi:hypothetical protein